MLVVENKEKNIINEELNCQYFYRLTRNDFKNDEFYGIEIERHDFRNGRLINLERENINYVETDKNKASELLNTLYLNDVSPIHLIDIVGEYSDKTIESYGIKEALCCS